MRKDLIWICLTPISEQKTRFGISEILIHDALRWHGQFRFWQTRTLYDETTYLNALRKRGSPLLKNLDLG
jgi:hypothetical protein